ncbi:MAG: glycosyltransferase [Bacteroidia bacterium]
MKHLLLLSPGFPENEQDTSCLPTVQAMAGEMSRLFPDLKISVVSVQYPFERKKYNWNGLNIYSMGGRNRKFPTRFSVWHQVRKSILEIHRRQPIDLIHSFWLGECALLGHFVAQKTGSRHLTTAMGQDVRQNNPYLKFLPLSRMFVTGLTPFQHRVFYASTGKSFQAIVPWGIHPGEFPPLNTSERPIHLLSVGSLIPLKNYGIIIDVVARLRHNLPDIRAEIVGDGPERAHLEQKVEAENLTGHIRFSGHLPREKVLEKMNNSRVLLHPSEYESFGYVFSEALYSGMNVCSRNTGCAIPGPRWHIAGDPEQWVKIAENALSLPQVFTRADVPTIAETVQTYYHLYQSLLEKT